VCVTGGFEVRALHYLSHTTSPEFLLKVDYHQALVAHVCNPPATQEAEVRSQPGQIVLQTLSQKKYPSQKRAGVVAQAVRAPA
jgi:hypothetical protein